MKGKKMTHRCSKCGSDNCTCKAEPPSVLKPMTRRCSKTTVKTQRNYRVASTKINRHLIVLGEEEILRMLRIVGFENIPDGALVVFRVPSGGDWSNEDVGVVELDDKKLDDQRSVIAIEWTTTEEK